MKYFVARDVDLLSFTDTVNAYLEEGWELVGGISAISHKMEGEDHAVLAFYQALQKAAEPELEFA